MVNKNYSNTNNRILQTMLIFTIAISYEIKAGKITKDKFKNINSNEEYKSLLVSSRVFMDNRQFYIKEFDNTYYYTYGYNNSGNGGARIQFFFVHFSSDPSAPVSGSTREFLFNT